MKITRITNSRFVVLSGNKTYQVNHYKSVGQMRWTCTCPARGECKHLRTVRGCGGLGVGDSIELDAVRGTSFLEHATPRPARAVNEDPDCEDQNEDYEDQHMIDDVGPEIEAARRGRGAYRKFLGY